MSWGPWRSGLDRVEYVASVRCLRACVRGYTRDKRELVRCLYLAESDPSQMDVARKLFDAIPTKIQRYIIMDYVSVVSPSWKDELTKIPKWLTEPEEADDMKASELFPGRFLKAADVQGKDLELIIARLAIEEIGPEKDRKPVLYFKNEDRGLVLNRINTGTLQDAYGDDTDDWLGKPATLFATKAQFGPKLVDALRIRVNRKETTAAQAQPASKKKPQQPAQTLAAELNDEIPFNKEVR